MKIMYPNTRVLYIITKDTKVLSVLNLVYLERKKFWTRISEL